MPTNLYGPNDNFDLMSSHVPAAFLRRFHEAKTGGLSHVTMWGTGVAQREFLHVDDLANACLRLLESYDSPDTINIGVGEDISIKQFAELVRRVVGFEGDILWDSSKPDGMPRKLLDTTKINSLGWKPSIGLEDGLRSTYEWYVQAVG
jgi:GDP-L-fucose synthase